MSELRDVLVIEDEAVVRQAVERVLTPEGLVVDLAADADDAREHLDRNRFRALVCDLMLPASSGFDLIPTARDIYPLSQIIVITGYATLDHALDSFHAGVFDFLPKPFDTDEIRGVVGRAVAFHDLQAAGTPVGSIARRLEKRDPAVDAYRLGRHAWVTIDADGSATLGAAETLGPALGRLHSIELPILGDRLPQGRALARLISADRAIHRVWSPLSGQVIAVNDSLADEPSLLMASPFDRGWLAKIVPDSLDEAKRLESIPRLATAAANEPS